MCYSTSDGVKSLSEQGKPKRSRGDVTYALAKAGLAGIPIIGGSAAEIYSLILVEPLSKRRDEWIESIAERLKLLEEKVEDFNIEDLAGNETFITTVAHQSVWFCSLFPI